LGTHLLGLTLQRYPSIHLDKVILAGSVLPTDYPWEAMLSRQSVNAVRNDVGRRDLVPRLAHLASRLHLLRGFGRSAQSASMTTPSSTPSLPHMLNVLGAQNHEDACTTSSTISVTPERGGPSSPSLALRMVPDIPHTAGCRSYGRLASPTMNHSS